MMLLYFTNCLRFFSVLFLDKHECSCHTLSSAFTLDEYMNNTLLNNCFIKVFSIFKQKTMGGDTGVDVFKKFPHINSG